MLRNLNKIYLLSENFFSVEIGVVLCYDKDAISEIGKGGIA